MQRIEDIKLTNKRNFKRVFNPNFDIKEETEKVRVWENHPENVKEGSPRIEIEYFGKENAYIWQTVKKYS